MNIFKESLFSSTTSNSKRKTNKTRSNHSKSTVSEESHPSIEPLLSPSENEDHSIELGTIDSDDNDDETTLNTRLIARSRHIKQSSKSIAHDGGSIVIVEKEILPQETIQAFAIRYRVPVSQLKRLNNLQNDQDFYALTHCRVPVRRFGILHESSPNPTIVNFNEQSTNNTTEPLNNLSQQNHHAFLNAMDQDLASMRAKVEQLIETPSTTLIPEQPLKKMIIRSATKPITDLNCDGADCGCKFWHIILTILLVALLIPLIYIYIYIYSPPQLTEHFP